MGQFTSLFMFSKAGINFIVVHPPWTREVICLGCEVPALLSKLLGHICWVWEDCPFPSRGKATHSIWSQGWKIKLMWVCVLSVVLKFAVLWRCEMILALPFPSPGCIKWWLVFVLSLRYSQGQKRWWWLTALCLSAVGVIPPSAICSSGRNRYSNLSVQESNPLSPCLRGEAARGVNRCWNLDAFPGSWGLSAGWSPSSGWCAGSPPFGDWETS